MGKCAWCGSYIADSGNKQAAKSLMGSMGLDLLVDAAGALTKQYCSKSCKQKAGESGSGGGGSGSSAEAQAAAKAAEAEAKKAEIEADRAKQEAMRQHSAEVSARAKEGFEEIASINFGDDPPSIVNALSSLLTIATKFDPKTEYYFDDKNLIKPVKKAALDKMEMGIMLLRSKGDTTQADYFQSKIEKGTLTGTMNSIKGFGKKLGLFK
ncbi:MAG: hypothetical protein LBU66_07430 [Treponema sp.]|jgi:hypothetical protein|nr:hypothetical protein [Treponema sp.]